VNLILASLLDFEVGCCLYASVIQWKQHRWRIQRLISGEHDAYMKIRGTLWEQGP
jgi:hypothetical protein